MSGNRKLAAIMFSDIVGYTALMGEDETSAYQLLKKNRLIQKPQIEKYGGKWLKEMGDGILASFQTISDAVYCAIEIQNQCKNISNLKLRIGIHVGEVILEDNDVFGEGVNIASRLETLAPAGGILVSESVYRNIQNKKSIKASFVREENLKNVKHPVKIYEVDVDGSVIIDGEEVTSSKSKNEVLHWKKPALWILFICILAVSSYLVYQPSDPDGSGSSTTAMEEVEKSIAVLPFKYLSEDESKQYLSEGVMDAITSKLAKISSLLVEARTSVEKYRDHDKSVPEIASELNVNYIVECSFLLHGDQVRLTVQLIRGQDGIHIFSKEYDREWSDIFEVQSEVAQTIAREINAVINPEEKQRIEILPTGNLTAYDLYLQAEEDLRNYYRSKDKDEALLDKALALYRSALEYDSTFAKAYMGLIKVYIAEEPDFFSNHVTTDSAQLLVEKALLFNDDYEEPYFYLASLEATKGNIDKALSYADQAQEKNPNSSQVYNLKANLYNSREDMVNTIISYHKAFQLEKDTYYKPRFLDRLASNYNSTGFSGIALFYAGEKLKLDGDTASYLLYTAQKEYIAENWDGAKKYFSQQYSMDSSFYYALVDVMHMFIFLGQDKEALRCAQRLDSAVVHKGFKAWQSSHRIGYAYWINGEKEKADAYFKKQIEFSEEQIRREYGLARNTWAYYDLAGVYAFLGDKEKAYEYLEEYNSKMFEHSNMVTLFRHDPLFNSIRQEARFQQIYQEIKAKYQCEHDKLQSWLEEEGMI
jgi:adenylate cyclase